MLLRTRSVGDACAPSTSRVARDETELRTRLEPEVDSLAFTRPDRNLLALGAEFFLPCLDRVGAGWKIFQIEVTVFVRHHKIWMFEYRDIASHPRMHIALNRNSNLLPRERFFHWHSVRLGLVPLPIVVGHRMDIVRGRIAVDDIKFLICLQCQYVRLVLAAFLLDHRR